MSATKSWTIHCDGCGEALGNGDLGGTTAKEVRRQAAQYGAVTRGSEDFCAECR